MEIDQRIIRVDYSITTRPHTPTPGVYKGRTSRRDFYDRSSYRDDDDYYNDKRRSRERRSPSPYYKERRRRSRSSSRDRKFASVK